MGNNGCTVMKLLRSPAVTVALTGCGRRRGLDNEQPAITFDAGGRFAGARLVTSGHT